MAKLVDLDDKNIKRKGIVKTVISVLCVAAVVFGAFISTERDKSSSVESTEPTVGVHVKGAVVNSGFYEVPIGTRVLEIEEYVGGFLENADLDSVNLASYVYDGQELYIPYKGNASTGAVNLNTAIDKELQTVSGIGSNYAKKIIDYRESHGGFTSVIELKSILSESTYKSVCEQFYVE